MRYVVKLGNLYLQADGTFGDSQRDALKVSADPRQSCSGLGLVAGPLQLSKLRGVKLSKRQTGVGADGSSASPEASQAPDTQGAL